MENVPLPFTFTLNWNPSYSYASIPKDIKDVPSYWTVLNTPVLPIEKGYCLFRNIRIENVEVVGADRIFTCCGSAGKVYRECNVLQYHCRRKSGGVYRVRVKLDVEERPLEDEGGRGGQDLEQPGSLNVGSRAEINETFSLGRLTSFRRERRVFANDRTSERFLQRAQFRRER